MANRAASIDPSIAPVTVSGSDAASTGGRSSPAGGWADTFGTIVGGISAAVSSVAGAAQSAGEAVATFRNARDNARGAQDATGPGTQPQGNTIAVTPAVIGVVALGAVVIYLLARKG